MNSIYSLSGSGPGWHVWRSDGLVPLPTVEVALPLRLCRVRAVARTLFSTSLSEMEGHALPLSLALRPSEPQVGRCAPVVSVVREAPQYTCQT